MTGRTLDKWGIAPTCCAQSVWALYRLRTSAALVGIDQVERRLHVSLVPPNSQGMSSPTPLFDPIARARVLRRADLYRAEFLHSEARFEIQERLTEVNKTFTDVSIVTPFAEFWQNAVPGAEVIAECETLPLAPESRDLVIHAMGLHWAADPVGQLIQSRRALRPDGLFLGVMLGGQTLHELRAALATAEAEVAGGLSPRVSPMADVRDLGGLLGRAGLALPVADTLALTASYETLPALARDLRAMGEGNALAQRLRHPSRRAIFARAEEILKAEYPAENGRFAISFELIFLAGWAPDASQQKPLRPGSAQTRLSDALGTTEKPAED